MRICQECCLELLDEMALYATCHSCSDSHLTNEQMICAQMEAEMIEKLDRSA